MQKKIWAIHHWVGFYWGVVIAILSVTGALVLFKVEIDRALNPQLFRVAPGKERVAISPVVERIKKAHPGLDFFQLEMSERPEDSWILRFTNYERRLFPIQQEFFIDPYSGELLGERNKYETFAYFLRNIHVRLYEVFWGRQIVGLAGIALLISTISGFWIYGRFMKRQAFGTLRGKKLRLYMADWHKLIGISALAFNLVIAITGGWLGLQPSLQKWLSIERPNSYQGEDFPLDEKADRNYALNYDSALLYARRYFPELIVHSIRPSSDGSRTVQVTGDVPGAIYERYSQKVVLDKKDYRPKWKYDIREAGWGSKLFFVQEALHFGDFGGTALKLVYFLLGMSSGFLSLSGFIIYLKRSESARLRRAPVALRWKPLLWRWTISLGSLVVLIAAASMVWGVGIPTVVVTVSFYLLLMVYILWLLLRLVGKQWRRLQSSRL